MDLGRAREQMRWYLQPGRAAAQHGIPPIQILQLRHENVHVPVQTAVHIPLRRQQRLRLLQPAHQHDMLKTPPAATAWLRYVENIRMQLQLAQPRVASDRGDLQARHWVHTWS